MEGKAEPSKNKGMDKKSAAIDTYVFFCPLVLHQYFVFLSG
jgi:hypothetical protein